MAALESKAIQDIGFATDGKQHRQWNNKEKSELDPTRTYSRQAFYFTEELSEDDINDKQGVFDYRKDVAIAFVAHKRADNPYMSETLRCSNTQMWAIRSAKA